MDKILEGVSRFQSEVFPKLKDRFQELASSQSPRYLFITCADSRIVPQLITQAAPGDLFICRNAGNMVPPYGEVNGGVSATIEYAVCVLGVKHIIICGHSDCGAMKGILHPEAVAEMPTVASWLRHGDVARRIVQENHPGVPDAEVLPLLTRQNVVAQIANLATHPSVAARVARGALGIHGWMYHISDGRVETYNPATREFEAVGLKPAATPQPAFAEVA